MDAAELRRLNFIPPEAFPYKTPTGSTYENADLPGVLKKALKLGDWNGFAKRREQSAANGKLRGIGISTVIENTGAGNADKDEVELRLDASGAIKCTPYRRRRATATRPPSRRSSRDALGVPHEQVENRAVRAGHASCRAITPAARAARWAPAACAISPRRS